MTDITGTLSVTEQADTLSSAGATLVRGTLTRIEAPDKPASFGVLTISSIPNQDPTSSFAVNGTFAVIPSLTYADDGGSAILFPSGSIEPPTAAANWSFNHLNLASGTHTITVTETVTGATLDVSVVVAAPAPVTGTMAVTEASDTIVANGFPAALATLTVTEANDTLLASSRALVLATLTKTEADDTLVAAGRVGSAVLRVTEANDTLVAAAVVPIIGTLIVTEGNDAYIPPVVPPRQRGRPIGYRQGVLPILQGGAEVFAQRQFAQIAATIEDLLLLTPQAATKEPPQLRDGMLRLARAPWRPVLGQDEDRWVYWDGAGQVWRFDGDKPTNT